MIHRDVILIRRYFVALVVAAAWLPAAAHAVALTISPSSVAGNYTGTVTLNISSLANNQVVRVEAFVDVNGNGAVDAGDMLVQSFTVTDGQALSIGGVRDTLVPGDEDATADGKIRAVLYYPGAPFFNIMVTKYVYRVSPVSGSFPPVTKAFTVNQPSFPQKVKGTVRSNGSPVAGAFVFIFTSNSDGPALISVTGSDGQFTLNADVGTYFVGALKDGFGFDFSTAPQVTVAAGQTVTQDVTLTATDRTISGRLTDVDSGVGLPGVWVSARLTDNPFTAVFTDANGNFSLHVSAAAATQWQLDLDWQSLALLGYDAPNNRTSVDVSGESVSGVSLQMRQVTALIYGTLTNAQSQPVGPVGFEAQAQSNNGQYDNYGVADASGHYVVGVTDGTWQVGPSSRGLATLGYVASGANVTVSEGAAKRQDFVAQLPLHLSGRVTDDDGQPVGNICINAYPNQGGNGPDTTTDANGNFSLPVASGSWNLQLCNEDALQRGLVVPTLSFPNITQDVTGIQYVAKRGTFQISGWVKDGSNGNSPVSGIGVSASITVGQTRYQSWQSTDGGNFSLPVFNGMWRVEVYCGDLQSNGYTCVNGQDVTIAGANGTAYFTVYPQGALQITTTSLTNGTQGQSYGAQLNASGGSGSYSWALVSGSLPPNLNLSTGGYISGTPTNSGTYNFTVRVSDNGGHAAEHGLSITIIAQPLQITIYGLPSGQVGVAYSTQLQASGGQPPYTWSLTPGSAALPPGLNLSADGIISGTPTTYGNNLSFFIEVTDSANNIVDRNFSISISPAPLQWITATLPDGRVGSAYSTLLHATGGVPPYYWTLAAGSLPLPPGLNLDPGGTTPTPGSTPGGTIYGTPTTEGTFHFIVRVMDSYGGSVNRSFSLFIQPRGATPTATATATATPTPRTPGPCVADCSGDGRVTVDEILTMVNIALGEMTLDACEPGDMNHDEDVTIDEILAAVGSALDGCYTPPTATPTPTPTSSTPVTSTTIDGGIVSAQAGQTALVPITMVLATGMQCATLQFTLTVVPDSGATVTFTSAVGAPSLVTNNGPATVVVGWFSSFSPLLVGMVSLGTLSVPIPAGASFGDTYTVQVLNPSGTTDVGNDLPISGVNGVVTVIGSGS